ncbi:hypothetical protein GCM10027018_18750 [Paenibacillus thermoaerophilus]
MSARFLAAEQPEKLAAAEWHFETGGRAPLIVGGRLNPDTQEVAGALKIPLALSLLATHDPDGTVVGLNDIPRDEWPPLYVHDLFDAMVGIGFYLLAVPVLYLALLRLKRRHAYNRRMLAGILAGGPLSLLAAAVRLRFLRLRSFPSSLFVVPYLTLYGGVTNPAMGRALVAAFAAGFVLLVPSLVLLLRLFLFNARYVKGELS